MPDPPIMSKHTKLLTHHVAKIQHPDLLTSTEVCQLADITYRTLDNWVRMGLLAPVIPAKGSGSSRMFDPSVIDEIAEMRERIKACPYQHPQNYGRN